MEYPTLQLQERTFANRFKRKLKEKIEDKVLSKVKAKLPARLGGTRGRPTSAPSKPVTAALIGVGNIAQWAYLPRIRAGNGFHLRGVFDVNMEAAKAVADEFSARRYDSVDELISDEDISAVFVCSPPRFHCEAARSALQAGKHVLCEKPLASSYAEARDMWETARTATARHMVNFSYRYRPDIAHFIDIVRSGMLGTVYHVTGTFSQGQWFSEDSNPSHERGDDAPWRYQAGGGIVFELGAHLIDILRSCFGEVHSVSAWTEPFSKEASECDNACGMTIKFNQGTMAHVITSRFATGFREHSSLEVSGSRGCLKFEEGALRIWTRSEPKWRELFPPPPDDQDFLTAFHCSIHQHSKVVPGFWDGFKNNEVIEAVYQSAQTGGVVKLPLDIPAS